tara:strand:+ start:19 stop:1647 length:1629 start_codon:yes stop_codon:yes gene_type:complete
MATVIQIKRSTGTSAPSTLKLGELAYTFGTGTQGNLGDRLFVGEGGVDGNGDANNITVIGGQYFSDMLDHVAGTLTVSSALIVDANKAIDELFVGNSATVGGTVKFNEGTNNGANFIGLKSPNSVSSSVTFTLPGSDGSSGHVLITDGSGGLSFSAPASSSITLAADSGSNDTYNTGETLTFTGGTGIDTTVSDNELTFAIDSTVTTLTGSQTLTNKTLTAPKFANAGFIADANGNEQLRFNTTSSAVNQFDITNSATGTGVKLSTSGGDSNIDIVLDPKGSGVVDVNTSRISNVTDPTQAQDAATKAYVDAVKTGLDVKDSVVCATTANITIATALNVGDTIDGVSLSDGDRVLVKDQTDATENGIYVAGSSPARAGDANANGELTGGSFVFVEQGTANGDNGYVFTHNGTPTLGSTNLTVAQFSGAGQITAGAALTKTGNQLDVGVDDSSIEVSSDALRVKSAGITNTMLAGSIDLTSKVTGTLPVANGGTGAASLTANRMLVANGTSAIAVLGAGTAGQVMLSNGASAPAFGDIDGGTF